MDNFLSSLKDNLSIDTEILTKSHRLFDESLARWSNIDLKIPEAVIKPVSEADIVTIVKAASAAHIPLVPATGGHSPWSTVENGIIIDLGKHQGVEVDAAQHVATAKGGILMKEFQLALSKEGQFTTVANGNTVGVVPYCIGGGVSSYTPLIGWACENILSARIITASGDIVEASDSQNSDLLWALRGAGQFFGIVLELTLRTYDLSLIGPGGVRQIGVVYFPINRAAEVCNVLARIVEESDYSHASSGHFMVMKDPERGHVLMLAPQYFGTSSEFQAQFKPILDLEPIFHQHMDSTFAKHSDHLGWMCPKGEFKRFSQTGMAGLNAKNFAKLVELHRELLETCPGAERTVFTLEWHTQTPPNEARKTPTSFGLKSVDIWLNILTWYTDPALHEKMLDFDKRAQQLMRSGTTPSAYVAYTNTSRDDPIEYRYKGTGAVSKLEALKREWDPQGVFTRELL
ncbi:MAG: hypothetical protein M1820_007361 [Bogoriella megaspora]|nr:MAG: hypothetical protein M1820_007361 [Bogoriella megaspora]